MRPNSLWSHPLALAHGARRNADKLTIKTNKYSSGKLLHPIMNVFTVGLKNQDVEEISAYYRGLGKTALVSPMFVIKGDE